MATIAHTTNAPPAERRKYVWELPIRLTHWVNTIAILVLFLTGMFIAAPILAPQGEAANHFVMGRMRELHFIFGFALLIAIAEYPSRFASCPRGSGARGSLRM